MIDSAEGELDSALLMYKTGCNKDEARQALHRYISFEKALNHLTQSKNPGV